MYKNLANRICTLVIPIPYLIRMKLITLMITDKKRNILARVQATILQETEHQSDADLNFRPLTWLEHWLFSTYIQDKKEKRRQQYLLDLAPKN